MSTDFDQLIADIELEAQHEGPQAVRELAQFRKEFRLASTHVRIASSRLGSQGASRLCTEGQAGDLEGPRRPS